MAKQPDSWHQHVIDNVLPRMEATTEQATGFQPATGFGPVTFYGNRSPDDAAAQLPDAAATKLIAIGQIGTDLHVSIPKHEQLQELRLEITVLKNRLADLKRPLSEGGSAVPATTFQIEDVERQLKRAEKEFARQAELAEIRGARWADAARLHQATRDWALRGIPANCVCDVVSDAPVAELLKKDETIAAAVERYRHRQRELAADAHRIRSSPWPSSVAKAAAQALIDRLADQGAPGLDNAIEFGQDITFATKRLTSQVYNVTHSPGAIAYAEADYAIGLVCWLFKDQMLAKVNAEFDQISDDKAALSQAQREEMLAVIDADDLAAQRAECSLIWAAAERGEIIDFRATASPQAALGVALRTVPRAPSGPSSPEHAGYNIIGGR